VGESCVCLFFFFKLLIIIIFFFSADFVIEDISGVFIVASWRRGVVASWDVFTTLRDYVLAALLRLTVVWISTVVYFLKKVVIECNVCFSLSVSD
jgi:hypothetical protein